MLRRFAPSFILVLTGACLSIFVARATVESPAESALAVLHIAALLGGPLLIGWGFALASFPRYQWPALVMLVVTGPVALLVAAEAGSRLTGNYGYNGWEAYEAAQQTPRVWRGHPGLPREFVSTVHTNRWGFHDVEPPPITDRPRVLLIGDSQVEAAHVSRDSSTAGQLRRLCPGADIMAIGRGGWGAHDHLAALREWGDSVAPDIVLVGHYTNDVPDGSDAISAARQRVQKGLRPFMVFARRHRLQVAAIALQLVSGRLHERAIGDDRWGAPTTDVWRDAWATHRRRVAGISQWADSMGVSVAWWGVPSRTLQQGEIEGAEYTYERQERIVEALGRDYVPVARKAADLPADSAKTLHWPADGHLNAAGHRYAATRLAEYLAGQGYPCEPPATRSQ